jgi:hypothetical protein
MRRSVIMIATILLSVFFIGAETVSLTGTVKKTGGVAGIAGVKVSLVKLPALLGTTGADGSFSLTGSTASITSRIMAAEPVRFTIRGNAIVFAPTSKGVCGRVAVFSGDGKLQSHMRLNDLSMGNQNMTLPRLGPGVKIMQVTIGSESFTRTLVCVGSALAIKNDIAQGNDGGRLVLAKQLTAAAVDTLKAEKSGYITKKTAIQSYTAEAISIELDTASAGVCTREALKTIADSYVAAQKAGDPSKMPLASQVTYLQNNKTITADKSICKTAMPIDNSMSLFDVDSCRAFVEIISSSGGTPWVLMMWLKTDNGQITGIDAMVTTTGDFQFDAKAYLNYTKAQDWSILPAAQQSPRQQLVRGGNAYLDAFTVPSVDTVPWGSPCERVEGGKMHITPDCKVGMPTSKSNAINITNRRYVVDVDMGTVDIFCSFGGSMPDSHMFRLIDGKIRLVHTLSVQNK